MGNCATVLSEENAGPAGSEFRGSRRAAANQSSAGTRPGVRGAATEGTVQREVQTQLARRLLKGEVRDGQAVLVGHKDGDLTFTPQAAPHPAAH